ncbi:hypothetical protein FQR65_LT13996 [Abscondita terminalis]|nr:hypothetical protein FQR65_LT13996 [Abscondita terminalis]
MEFDSKIYASSLNPIVGDKIKTEIDETHQSYLFLDKDEVKQEFVEDSIKTEGIIDDDCVSFNTDMSLCIEERVPVNISYCDYCNYGTNDKQNHIFTHSMSTTHTHNVTLMCNVCNFTCVGSDVLNEHMSAHTPNFNCDKCDYETFGKNHKTVHSERKPYKCSLCAYSSNYPGYLKLHFKRHSGEGSLSCDKCDYKGYSKNLLKLHKTVHSERKSFNAICAITSLNIRLI